ncbi:MAG TPA: hypothetical protein PKD86_13930, partial [Gemmatales bacterium]|nr:hypothetical protein [Gemmatales bacterium]
SGVRATGPGGAPPPAETAPGDRKGQSQKRTLPRWFSLHRVPVRSGHVSKLRRRDRHEASLNWDIRSSEL